MKARRPLRPTATSALAVAPVTCTDRTAPIVFGLEPRVFRGLLARQQVPHARLGKRVIARVEDVLAAIDRLASKGAADDGNEAAPAEDVEPTADAILARIGRSRAVR